MTDGGVRGFEGLDAATLEALARRGQLVVVNEERGQFRSVTAGVAIDAPVATVWDVITAYETYPEFMPQIASTRVTRNPPDSIDVDFVLALKLPVGKFKIKYKMRHHLTEHQRIDFELLGGDLKHVEGGWQLIQLGDDATLGLYTVYTDLKSLGRIAAYVIKQDPSFETAINTSSATMVAGTIKQRVEGRSG